MDQKFVFIFCIFFLKNLEAGKDLFEKFDSEQNKTDIQNKDQQTNKSQVDQQIISIQQDRRSYKIVYDQRFLQEKLRLEIEEGVYSEGESLEDLSEDEKNDKIYERYYAKIITMIQRADEIIQTLLLTKNQKIPNIFIPQHYDKCDVDKIDPKDDEQINVGSDSDDETKSEISDVEQKFLNKLSSDKFKKNTLYQADLVVFIGVYYYAGSDTLAQAYPCEVVQNGSQNIPIVGFMEFNLANLSLNKSQSDSKDDVHVTLHELMHIISFHDRIQKEFEINPFYKNYHHLQLLLKAFTKTIIYPMQDYYSHWNAAILPQDIQIPNTQNGNFLSIFSLEYIELGNSNIITNKEYLQYDHVKHLSNQFEQALQYKCGLEENIRSQNQYYCTLWQLENQPNGCSVDYKNKSMCVRQQYSDTIQYDQDLDDDQKKLLKGALENYCFQKTSLEANSDCTDKTNEDFSDNHFEVFGSNSRCFEINNRQQSACLQFEILSDSKIIIEFRGQKQICQEDNQILIFDNQQENFTVSCPNIEEFIYHYRQNNCPDNCHYNGICQKGKCKCYQNWDTQTDCKTRKQSIHQTTFVKQFVILIINEQKFAKCLQIYQIQ